MKRKEEFGSGERDVQASEWYYHNVRSAV
jgi:hypothetical protein